jgi:hypothetical protein
MSVRVDLQGISTGYFIDRRDALGVMTGQYTLLEYQTAGFSPGCEGFLLEQCLRTADSGIFCGFCAKGHLFARIRLKTVPGCVQRENKIHGYKCRENHHRASTEFRSSLFIADIQTSLVQSSRKACSTQIGDE